MGEKPCGADATVFAFVASFSRRCSKRRSVRRRNAHANLAAYKDRIRGFIFAFGGQTASRGKRRLIGAGRSFRFAPSRK